MEPVVDVTQEQKPHTPVLIDPLIERAAPVSGVWLDGTFGAGGYTRALLKAGADLVIGVDRDPLAFDMAQEWVGGYGERIHLQEGVFSKLDGYLPQGVEGLDGVVLDLGVSSMQLDLAERGFSFMRDGPLDMRMSQEGPSAADLVNTLDEVELANILYYYGEERQSRRIARAIVAARPLERTLQLAQVVEGCLPRPKPGQSHPATRSFQALRIAVNDEYGELGRGLLAAERVLKPGGILAVVSFHSTEDRMVKRFFQMRAGRMGAGNRYAPDLEAAAPTFELMHKKAIGPSEEELALNIRARSAKLRMGRRLPAKAPDLEPSAFGMPVILSEKPRKSAGGRGQRFVKTKRRSGHA